ncbi:M23 family metallopeptidase [Chryseobacterium lactis]|uniref:M23 family metallopeptidase n=1 Tax=Chryseobacterium lactis TaxID=1241981 RepID=UPI00162344AF|nr:M23 family metallopeptidase [Chryseobacterium lactis]
MKFCFLFLFINFFQLTFSQIYKCPISDGQIINGYKNNEVQQRYKATFLKDNPNISPVDLTVITNNENAEIRSVVKGIVSYIGNDSDYIAIIYDKNKMIVYDLIEKITLKKGDIVEIGTVVGKVKLNNFMPKNYKKILDYTGLIYSVNLSFYAIDDKTGNLIHFPKFAEIINCKTIICEKCQPIIHGM